MIRSLQDTIAQIRRAHDVIFQHGIRSPNGEVTVMLTDEFVGMLGKIIDLAEQEMFTADELFAIYCVLNSAGPSEGEIAKKVREMHERRLAEGIS